MRFTKVPFFSWRYWPMELLYLPLTAYVFCIGSLRTGKLFYFAAANPKIPLGGFAGDSKFEITCAIPDEWKPKTILIRETDRESEIPEKLHAAQISFPMIAKPDLGEGGFLVQKLETQEQLLAYHRNFKTNYLLQEFIDFPKEYSVLIYHSRDRFEISSITERTYLMLTGDGFSSVETLIRKHPKAQFRTEKILANCLEIKSRILQKDEQFQPLAIGNWDYGATYSDRSDLINEPLRQLFEQINRQVNLFHYARYDLKCQSEADLSRGNMKILEINGVKGEPIHLYDQKYNLLHAYREIFKHWEYILRISQRNRLNGAVCPTIPEGFKLLRQHAKSKKKARTQKRIHE